MDAFPAFFPLAGRTVVIAGAGEGAEAKARLFEGSPATVVRLEGEAALAPAAYAGAALVFVASEDEAFARAAAAAARSQGAPVNVVDRPLLCDFTTPAVIDRGEVVAAIGTGGASPMLATLLRQDLEARIPEGAGRIAALFRLSQDEVRVALPDTTRRRAFLRAALSGPAAEAALAGDMALAMSRLRHALATAEPQAGRVQILAADGQPDLLSLRAVRALAAADLLALGEAVNADILSLARRDADRGAAAAASLAAAARDGRRALALVPARAVAALQAALLADGVEVEVLPLAR